ncbi:MAG: DUF6503 family protein, partial [Acidobacteriota bacterium]
MNPTREFFVKSRPTWLLATLVACSWSPGLFGDAPPPADDLLARSIAHHDPGGHFLSGTWCLGFSETRPGSSDRRTEIVIDVPNGRFEMVRRAEREIAGRLGPGLCEMTLDGRTELTEAERGEHRISCERLQLMRNYYVYLWGLPMKLRDPGTRLGEVAETTFMEREVYGLRVTYDAEVGDDTWYFYFDRGTAALV